MKIIGITGKAGSGKTTFSDYLGKKQRTAVIHIDDLFSEIKLKYFKFFMNNNTNKAKTKMTSKHKRILYTNPLLFKIFMKFRSKSVEKRLNRKIEDLSKNNDTILIDDIFIKYHKVYKQMNEIFLMERPYVERCTSLLERDSVSKEELVLYDVANRKGKHDKIGKKRKVTVISNKTDKEDLEKTAELIYREKFEKTSNTLKERCKSNIPINVPSIGKNNETESRNHERTLD